MKEVYRIVETDLRSQQRPEFRTTSFVWNELNPQFSLNEYCENNLKTKQSNCPLGGFAHICHLNYK